MSTIIDQAEIDTLLAAAQTEAAATAAPAGTPPPPRVQATHNPLSSKIARLLRLKVPVIAELSRTPMPMARARRLATGMILEFDHAIEEHCRLLINNQLIATGEVVRAGDHFGLRILSVEDARARIESLGRRS